MVNINLVTEKITVKEPRLFKREVVVLFAILSILIVSYGGMIIYQGQLIKKTEQKNAEYQVLFKELTEGNTRDVFDFQNRLNVSRGLVDSQGATLKNLNQLQTVIIPRVYINTFSYSALENKISLECIAADYDAMAKQILSFKQSNLFSAVIVNSSENTERGVSLPGILVNK